MSAAPRKEITTREVVAVRFGMLTDDEVRKLSVKRVTSPVTYDSLMNVVPDGLYDAAMGPVDFNGRCTTCGLNSMQCPGHFGHVELPVAVYHPMVFPALYKLVRHTCFNCHQFKMGRDEAAGFLARLECLSRGDLPGAAAVRGGRASKAVREASEAILAAAEDEGALLAEDDAARAKRRAKLAEEDRAAHRRPPRQPLTCHVQEALRDTVAELYSRMPTQKCANCGATNPTVKRQGATKLFREFSRKALVANLMRGIDMGDADLSRLMADRAVLAAVADEGKGQKRKRGGKGGGGGSEDEEEKGEVDEEEADGEEGGDEEGGAKGKGAPKAGGKAAKAGGGGGGKPLSAGAARIDELAGSRYLQPDQVERMLSRLCEKEGPLLAHLFGCASGGGGGGGAAGGKAGARRLVQVFFLHALAVPPPQRAGRGKYEHAQNVTLQRIINAGLSLQSSGDALAGGGGESGLAALSAEQRRLERDRFTQAWLRLQGEVNALIDSTTAENKDQPGIRQQLEKKEGLFRKNMMGKREYVTPWNVERLRA
ncbi:MAG: hypothetical protein J3K34DRAFT_471284, partial [Monoraphidium minutum]